MRPMNRGLAPALAAAAILGLPLAAVAGAAVPPAPTVAEADAWLAAGQFAEAAAAYQAIAMASPRDGRAWFRLGFALHALGRYGDAIAAFERADPVHSQPAAVAYRIARAHARLNDGDRAIEWLGRAVDRGFNQAEQLRDDPDLALLRGDPRFASIRAAAEREAAPCALDPRYRATDFMKGEWSVVYQGRDIGSASIRTAADGCALLEEYSDPNAPGQDGRTLTVFDAQEERWRQLYVDASANVNHLTGVATAAGFRFTGEHHPRRGAAQLLRVDVERLAAGGFRQTSEQSRDGGVSWQRLYDIEYRPRTAGGTP